MCLTYSIVLFLLGLVLFVISPLALDDGRRCVDSDVVLFVLLC